MTLSMWVNWWSNIFSSLSLTSPFILIIDRGQQSFALSLTRKRAVRTTLRNLYFVFKKKKKKQQATSLILFPYRRRWLFNIERNQTWWWVY
jgi:hypothetical protein